MNRVPIGKVPYADGLIYKTLDIRGTSLGDIFKPSAIHQNNTTYFTWIDKSGNIMVSSLLDGTVINEEPVLVAPRSDYETDIEHSIPSMLIDANGYIYIFYGCHGSPLLWRKSTNPYDITSWSVKKTVTGVSEATYPCTLVLPNNTLVVFYRKNNNPPKGLSFIKSTDGGENWSITNIIMPTGTYWTYPYGYALGNETPIPSIHIVVNFRPDGALSTDPFGTSYYLKSLDGGTTWRKADGTQYTLLANQSNLEVIRNEGSYPGDLKVNSQNQAYICYTLNSDSSVVFTRWDGSSWTSPVTVCARSSYKFEMCAMDIINDSTIDIYAVFGTVTNFQGGNIKRFRSTDSGSTWNLAEDIASNANGEFRYYSPKLVSNYTSAFKMLYISGIPATTYGGVDFRLLTYP